MKATSEAGRVWLVAVAIAALQIAGFHSLRHDDAFISFRYAQNLATGQGLVFNPGERLMGSTSPGHVLLAALGYSLVGREWLPSLMSALGCLGWIAQAVAVFAILQTALGRGGAWFVALCIAAGVAWSHRFVALETNLAAAFVTGAIAFALRSRWMAAACLSALAGLMRPDAYLVALPLGLLCLIEMKRASWKAALAGAMGSAPWFIFAASYFGTVIPQSAVSKAYTAPLPWYAIRLFNYPAMNLLAWRLSFRGMHDVPNFAAWAVWLAALAGAYLLIRRDPRLWVLPSILALYVAAYLALRATVGMEWHLYPIMLFLAVLSLAALVIGADTLLALAPQTSAHVWVALSLGLVLVVGYRTSDYVRIHEKGFWYGARDRVYRCVADYISAHSSPRDVVVADEVGTISYYSQLPMIDLEGLMTINPRERIRTPGRKPRWYVWVPAYAGIGAYKGIPAFEGDPSRRAVFRAQSEVITPEELNLGATRFSAVVLDEGQTGSQAAHPKEAEEALMKAGLDALYALRDPSAAVVQFRAVLTLHPDHYDATFQLAVALDRAGAPNEARPFWEKALRMAECSGDKETADTARARLREKP